MNNKLACIAVLLSAVSLAATASAPARTVRETQGQVRRH